MEKKTVTGIMLTLLLIGMLTLTIDVQPVRAEPKTWYVDDDGGADFTKIQDAIYAASIGDRICVYNGMYYEHLQIDKSLTLIGEDKYATIIDGSGYGPVVIISASRTNLTNFTVRNAGSTDWNRDNGIRLYQTQFSQVTDCIVSGCAYGIREIWEGIGGQNVISGNIVSDATEIAIGSSHPTSIGNIVANNIIKNSRMGIYFNNPYNLQIVGNTISDMTGEATYGIHLQVGGSDNTVIGNTVIGYCSYGIAIRHTDENLVSGNTLLNSFYGIELSQSSCDNTIIGNNVLGNGVGISVFDNSNNNLITMNDFSDSVPIDFYISNIGIWVESSHGNTIHRNNITNNGCGFYVPSSSNNKIYHNNIIDNTIQVYSFDSANIWDDGYPVGGNYWSNYVDEDIYGGPNQDQPGSDRIWDHPYVIDADNKDNYPLVEQWEVISATVNVYPETINTWSLLGKLITVYIELPEGYNVGSIDVSTVELNGEVQAQLRPTKIGDYDMDGTPDLMVKFDRTDVVRSLLRTGENTLTITGTFTGKSFKGACTVKVVH